MIKFLRPISASSGSVRGILPTPHSPPSGTPSLAPPPQVALRFRCRGLHTLTARPARPSMSVTLPAAGALGGAVSRGGGVLGGLTPPRRHLWGWLNAIFNKVDESRIRDVGPDRACAEWLLRCGAVVRWLDRDQWTKDYNSLPTTASRALRIEEVDATDAAIMHIGFPHFKNCKYIRRIIFHRASYLDDTALSMLPVLSSSLKQLQISACGNITVEGLRHIHHLKNLDYLLLYDLPEIEDKDAVVKELKAALPNCRIDFPYALAKDDPSLKKKEEEEEGKDAGREKG